ncbi:hypothetical protein EVJ58_g7913 [Rhodofomes roseus]|uniref:F-box domain-containing protein n=1 Tax=Rhodofomes roseus TaxID=34475 RepID=A0A4Y9Y595_9APHY|nr:hypothetical protein EVJ58_g7913 [Rhodofomes roseus]
MYAYGNSSADRAPSPTHAMPIEIVEEIIDHNRYDPPTLLACALVCRDWAPRSQCHLQRKPTLTIRSAAQLNLIGSLLVSKRSRGLYAKVRLLRIIDDPSTPFFHSLPLCLPGQHLPEVAAVLLEGVDWTTFRPHVSFFTWLSRFSSVTSLCIHGCALRPVAHTLRMARGLPKLKQTLAPLSDRMRDYAPVDTVVALDNVLIGTDADAELRELHMRAHPDLEHQHRSLEAVLQKIPHIQRANTLPSPPAAPSDTPRRAYSDLVPQTGRTERSAERTILYKQLSEEPEVRYVASAIGSGPSARKHRTAAADVKESSAQTARGHFWSAVSDAGEAAFVTVRSWHGRSHTAQWEEQITRQRHT